MHIAGGTYAVAEIILIAHTLIVTEDTNPN
jgi:hypothetical protein